MNELRWISKVVIVSFIIALLPQQLKSQQNTNQRLKFKADTLFFEPIIAGNKVHLSFQFKVDGAYQQKTKIHQVYTGCSCTATDYAEDSLELGEQGEVKLTFDSEEWGTDTGFLVNKHIYVIYNGGSQVIFFQGKVYTKDTLSKIRYNKQVHDFGEIPYRKGVSFTFVLYNYNRTPIQIQSVKSSGGPVAKWSKDSIMHGDSTLIKVSFGAHNPGPFNKKLMITTNLGSQVLTIKGRVPN